MKLFSLFIKPLNGAVHHSLCQPCPATLNCRRQPGAGPGQAGRGRVLSSLQTRAVSKETFNISAHSQILEHEYYESCDPPPDRYCWRLSRPLLPANQPVQPLQSREPLHPSQRMLSPFPTGVPGKRELHACFWPGHLQWRSLYIRPSIQRLPLVDPGRKEPTCPKPTALRFHKRNLALRPCL